MINPFLFLFRAHDKPRSAVIQPITAFQKRSFREAKPWKIAKKKIRNFFLICGSPGRARTYNNPVNSRVLCH